MNGTEIVENEQLTKLEMEEIVTRTSNSVYDRIEHMKREEEARLFEIRYRLKAKRKIKEKLIAEGKWGWWDRILEFLS